MRYRNVSELKVHDSARCGFSVERALAFGAWSSGKHPQRGSGKHPRAALTRSEALSFNAPIVALCFRKRLSGRNSSSQRAPSP